MLDYPRIAFFLLPGRRQAAQTETAAGIGGRSGTIQPGLLRIIYASTG
jgi:hypothetical protein